MPKRSAFSAVRWVLASSLAQRAVGFVGLALVARIAQPEVFGAFRALLGIHLVANVLLPMGFDQLVVRERRPAYILALRACVVAMWGLLAGAAILFAQPLAAGLALGADSHLVWGIPVVLLFQAIAWGIRPLHAARMDFRRLGIGEFLESAFTYLGGALLLIAWRDPAALYVAYGVGELVESIWLWRRERRPRGARSHVRHLRQLGRRHRRFCSVIGVDQGVNVFAHNIPVFMLGGLIGQAAVGLFGAASTLVAVPLNLLLGAIGRVALPALAGRAEAELRHRVLLALGGAAAFVPPLLIWIVFFAPLIVPLALGVEWGHSAIPVVRWLALALLFQGLFSPISAIDVLRDRPEATLAWNVANAVVRAGVLVVAAPFGFVAAVAAYSIASAIMWLIYGRVLSGLLGAGHRRFMHAWIRWVPLWISASGALGGIVYAVGAGWTGLFASLFPAVAYLVAIRLMDREVFSLATRVIAAR